MEEPNDVQAGPSNEPHRMRISSGGSIPAYVKFALSFLETNPHRSLVLHTIPPDSSSSNNPGNTSESKINISKNANDDDNIIPTHPAHGPRPSTLHSCTLTAPRLISVVEKIKRDYLEHVSCQSSGKHRARGIWQYTESGLLPTTPLHDDLERVLSGKTKPKMIHKPYLQITLSTRPLGLEDTKQNTTCQYVIAKRRRRKGKPPLASGEKKEMVNKMDDHTTLASADKHSTQESQTASKSASQITVNLTNQAITATIDETDDSDQMEKAKKAGQKRKAVSSQESRGEKRSRAKQAG